MDEALAFAGKSSTGRAMRLKALIGDLVRKQRYDQCPYYYSELVRRACSGKTKTLLEGTLNAFFPALPAGTEYLEKAGVFLVR